MKLYVLYQNCYLWINYLARGGEILFIILYSCLTIFVKMDFIIKKSCPYLNLWPTWVIYGESIRNNQTVTFVHLKISFSKVKFSLKNEEHEKIQGKGPHKTVIKQQNRARKGWTFVCRTGDETSPHNSLETIKVPLENMILILVSIHT